MKLPASFRTLVVAMATIQLVVPVPYVRAEPESVSRVPVAAPQAFSRAADVTLGAEGRLSGQVVDANGQPKKNTVVAVRQFEKLVAETTTDAQGRFRVEQLRGGACEIHVEGLASGCRCWTANAAPPAAKPEILVVADARLQRGQRPIGEILTNPLLIGLVIAAAVAIPIAIHNAQDNPSGS